MVIAGLFTTLRSCVAYTSPTLRYACVGLLALRAFCPSGAAQGSSFTPLPCGHPPLKGGIGALSNHHSSLCIMNYEL